MSDLQRERDELKAKVALYEQRIASLKAVAEAAKSDAERTRDSGSIITNVDLAWSEVSALDRAVDIMEGDEDPEQPETT